MSQVETLHGPIDADRLGVTLMHEHLFAKNPELEENFPSPEWDEEAMIDKARRSLTELAAKGVDTLVDMTVLGMGRSLPRVLRVADGLPLAIVAATGYYTTTELPAFFRNHGPNRKIEGPEPLVQMFVKDITEGIAGTGVKAAMLKVASDGNGLTPDVERVFASAARAQLETGVPITTHSDAPKRTGLEQQAYFVAQGVDPARLIIGHSGDTTDLDYLKTLMDNGSYLGLDRFGMSSTLPDEDRMTTLLALCEQGYAERITLSQDASFFSINNEPSFKAVHVPDWHHHRLVDTILPELRRRGLAQEQLDRMMIRNPRDLLAR
jgi:phosphotriesterase-related protein